MKLDITLRSLTGFASPALIRMIAGSAVVAVLPTGFPSAGDRRVDTLVELEDGRILHIEWQAGYDATMPWRMLGYWLLITNACPGRVIEQVVIQVGGQKPIAASLETGTLSFRYRVLDSRALDPAPLLASERVEDAILAILFGPEAPAPSIRAILARIATLGERARRDALTQLLTLSGARHAVALVLEEAKAMPLQIDIDQDPYLAELVHKGRVEGRVEGRFEGKVWGEALALIRLLEKRFGPLPAVQRERILAADGPAIEVWFDRAIDASDREVVFAGRPLN